MEPAPPTNDDPSAKPPLRIARVLRATFVGTVTGLAVTFVGVYGYSLLARANVRSFPAVPWAPLLTLPLLWLYWRYVGGWGWPSATRAYRRRVRRAHALPREQWSLVALATATGLVFVASAMTLAFRLSDLPADALRVLPADVHLPAWTSVSALIMLALVAGVAEEVGMRGYLQKPIEEAGAPRFAVLCSAACFTLLHADKEWFGQQALPMFVAATWYGYLTWASRSIYPMIAVHAVLDLALFIRYSILGAPLPASVPTAGFGPAFWINLSVAVVFCGLAFALTARLAVRARGGSDPARA